MIEAAPTVVPKSAAICGRSESVTRTIAWLANPAPANRMMERVGTSRAGGDFIGTARIFYSSTSFFAWTAKTWMAGISPVMTRMGEDHHRTSLYAHPVLGVDRAQRGGLFTAKFAERHNNDR